MLATFDLRHCVPPWHVLAISNVIVLIAAAGPVILTFDLRHVLYLFQHSNIESVAQPIRQGGVGPLEFFKGTWVIPPKLEPYRLMANVDSAFEQQFLHIPQAY